MTGGRVYLMAVLTTLCLLFLTVATEPNSQTREAEAFLSEFVGKLKSMQTKVNLAWWDASTTTASKTLTRIGEATGVVVDRKDDKASYGPGHDIRRAFGVR